MNRQERRRNKKQGKPIKDEPVYNMKPTQIVDAVLDGVGKDIIMEEIHRARLEYDRKATIDIDTCVLWCLHVCFGWGAVRLKRFYQALFEEHKRVREYYDIDDPYPERMKLKEIGVDVEAWYDELFTDEGIYKDTLEAK